MSSNSTKKPLIVLDIDGTLLDENYRMNNPTLPAYISKLEMEGIAFCINSNRSLHDLLPVAEQLCITGPLIGENGAFIYSPTTNTSRFLLSHNELEMVSNLKERAEKLLFEVVKKNFPTSKLFWEDIDTVDRISHHIMGKYSEGAVVILNNKYRQYTVSAHLKRYSGGKLFSMRKEVEVVAKELQTEFGMQDDVEISYSPLFANVLVSSRLASKRDALRTLREQDFGYSDLYVIGDEIGDFTMIDGIGTFLTTSNSAKSVKSKAKHVATSRHSKGVAELLHKIVSQTL